MRDLYLGGPNSGPTVFDDGSTGRVWTFTYTDFASGGIFGCPEFSVSAFGEIVAPWQTVSKSATYTARLIDKTIRCTSGTFTVSFPTAVGITGKRWTVVNMGAGTITLDAFGSQTISGAATIALAQWERATLESDGANLLRVD